jgi:hypothetical protein
MKDPTQLYNFKYLINTKNNNYIQQCTTVNEIIIKKMNDINLTIYRFPLYSKSTRTLQVKKIYTRVYSNPSG